MITTLELFQVANFSHSIYQNATDVNLHSGNDFSLSHFYVGWSAGLIDNTNIGN